MGAFGRWWNANRPYAAAAALVLVACAAFVLVIEFQLPSPGAAVAIDDVGEAIAALIAACAAIYATRRTAGRVRFAWTMLAISAASWGVGEAIWSYYEVGLGVAVPYPGWPDVGFLTSIPFAVIGIRAFWSEPHGTASRWQVFDGVIVFTSLTFTAWVLGLHIVVAENDSLMEHFLDLAYPIGDLIVGTVLILAVRRATRRRTARMLVLLAGVAAYTVADSAFTYLNANGLYGVNGSVLDVGWFAGYLLIALAAVWPRREVSSVADNTPVDQWQLALPWLTLQAAGLTALGAALTGAELDRFLTFLVGAGVIFLGATMIITSRDLLRMLLKSRASEALLAEVVEQAPVGIARADTQFRVVGANPALGALLGRSPESMLGLSLDRYIPSEDQPGVFAKLAALASGEGETASGELPMIRGDGSRVWTRWTTTAVKSSFGTTEYFLTTLEDIDARHQAEEAAKSSLETLERLNSLKTEFLQSVSHEFKTALIGIQGFSEFMRDADQLDINDVRGFAADIHRDAERLDRMVTEMVALDGVESTRSNIRLEPVDVNTVIAREVAGARLGSSAAIVTNLAPDLPPVAGDEEKLGLAVRTLLGNAAKYSPEGGRITVTTTLIEDVVTVGIRDEGVAARADFDNRLFGNDDLYADNPIRKVVGTGLGLGIVRQVVEMHGGRLWVDRVEGRGSEFHFTLPALPAAEEPVPATTGGLVA
jgi:two-component system, sensor histidine kinase and response regulator